MGIAKWVRLGVSACLASSLVTWAESRELRAADSFPAGHYLVRLLLKPWMEEVTKRTNGAVTFNNDESS